MPSLLRFCLRMTIATLSMATVGASFVAGYYIGQRQALHDASFDAAVVVFPVEVFSGALSLLNESKAKLQKQVDAQTAEPSK